MAPEAPSKIPTRTGEYTILPLQCPPVQSFPRRTTHYLYIRSHAPKLPTSDSSRSLFAVNLPIDATEGSLRKLFTQDALGARRVERVEFEDLAPKKSIASLNLITGKKRKRGKDSSVKIAEEILGEEAELPTIWDSEILRSGSCAVVVFVDRASAEAALKASKQVAKKRISIEWHGGTSLGLQSIDLSRVVRNL